MRLTDAKSDVLVFEGGAGLWGVWMCMEGLDPTVGTPGRAEQLRMLRERGEGGFGWCVVDSDRGGGASFRK